MYILPVNSDLLDVWSPQTGLTVHLEIPLIAATITTQGILIITQEAVIHNCYTQKAACTVSETAPNGVMTLPMAI